MYLMFIYTQYVHTPGIQSYAIETYNSDFLFVVDKD